MTRKRLADSVAAVGLTALDLMRIPRFRIPRLKFSRRLGRWLLLFCLGLSLIWGISITWKLRVAAQQPLDAVLVLGGSIHREVYAAQLADVYPDVPILISKGSPQPCIRLIFERARADVRRVWLEECADSTFTNYYYSLPVLQRWQVRKVRLITSGNHMDRAARMARIILGSHGIWVEPEAAPEVGRPGNSESRVKLALDTVRAMFWAIGSQVYQPGCDALVPLEDVNLAAWKQQGFTCQHQKQLGL